MPCIEKAELGLERLNFQLAKVMGTTAVIRALEYSQVIDVRRHVSGSAPFGSGENVKAFEEIQRV